MNELEELIFLPEFAKRYRMGVKKARAMMKSMPHHERPLFVTKSALIAWESAQTVEPMTKATEIYQRKRRLEIQMKSGKHIVPRERPEAV